MSIEGLWSILVNEVEVGGVAVLETGRILGGDNALAWVGHYEVEGDAISFDVRISVHNMALSHESTIFGTTVGDPVRLQGKSVLGDGLIVGHFWMGDDESRAMPMTLKHIADLP